jgi:hypothetical protein
MRFFASFIVAVGGAVAALMLALVAVDDASHLSDRNVLLGSALPPAAQGGGALPVRSDNKLGIYLTAANAADGTLLDDTLDRLAAIGGTAFVFDVKGMNVYFDADSPLAKEFGLVQPLYDLPAIVKKAKSRGFYTIARFIALKDPLLSAGRPETRIRHPKTGREVGSVWVDGASQTVLDYNREVLREIFKSGIDEVNFDYIRYPTEYAPAAIGLNGSEKAEHIIAFLRMAKATRDDVNPQAKIGISTYAIMGWDFDLNLQAVGQDFPRFAEYVDVISPMAYPSSFSPDGYYVAGRDPGSRNYFLVYQTIKGYAERLRPEDRSKLRPWIQGYFMKQKGITDQIDAVYDAGACGFIVWNAQNDYRVAFKAIAAAWDRVPERCRSAVGSAAAR